MIKGQHYCKKATFGQSIQPRSSTLKKSITWKSHFPEIRSKNSDSSVLFKLKGKRFLFCRTKFVDQLRHQNCCDCRGWRIRKRWIWAAPRWRTKTRFSYAGSTSTVGSPFSPSSGPSMPSGSSERRSAGPPFHNRSQWRRTSSCRPSVASSGGPSSSPGSPSSSIAVPTGASSETGSPSTSRPEQDENGLTNKTLLSKLSYITK